MTPLGRPITLKLHKDTLGRLYYGNNLHFECFGRHHRFVTASRGIDAVRERPESEWKIADGTFVLYHLFPNIQYLHEHTATLIRIYPVLRPLLLRDANRFYYCLSYGIRPKPRRRRESRR